MFKIVSVKKAFLYIQTKTVDQQSKASFLPLYSSLVEMSNFSFYSTQTCTLNSSVAYNTFESLRVKFRECGKKSKDRRLVFSFSKISNKLVNHLVLNL